MSTASSKYRKKLQTRTKKGRTAEGDGSALRKKMDDAALKQLKPPRITKKLRNSMNRKSRRETPDRNEDPMSNYAIEQLADKFTIEYLDYMKLLAIDKVILNSTTVSARKEVIRQILSVRFDHNMVVYFLAGIWNMSYKTLFGYAKEFYKLYSETFIGLSKVEAARRMIHEYELLIQGAKAVKDFRAASSMMKDKKELMGLLENDVWEGTGSDRKIPVVSHLEGV